MKSKITKPDNYETLSVEEKLKFFEGYEFEDNAETIQKLKDSVSNANSQAAEWKKKHNALLSADEQAKQAREDELQALKDQLQANAEELEQVKKDKEISDFAAQLTALGYESTLAKSFAESFSKGDVKAALSNLATSKKNLEEKIKADLINGTPKPKTGEGKEMTKEEFDKLDYSSLNKLYNENPELYKQLSEAE